MDGKELVKQTLDQIPQANSNAKRIQDHSLLTSYFTYPGVAQLVVRLLWGRMPRVRVSPLGP